MCDPEPPAFAGSNHTFGVPVLPAGLGVIGLVVVQKVGSAFFASGQGQKRPDECWRMFFVVQGMLLELHDPAGTLGVRVNIGDLVRSRQLQGEPPRYIFTVVIHTAGRGISDTYGLRPR